MGSGTSRSSLTRDECKQRVPEDKWDDSWDDFYFDSDLKTVSREIAERVWAKSERWEAYVATGHAPAEPKDGGVEERDGSQAEDAPVDRVADARESNGAARGRTRADADATDARDTTDRRDASSLLLDRRFSPGGSLSKFLNLLRQLD